jgi:alcohol dehydrogenase (NADP+)
MLYNTLLNSLVADVTLFTRSPGKEQNARRLGAYNIVISTDTDKMTAVNNKFDLIIDAVPYTHDLSIYTIAIS